MWHTRVKTLPGERVHKLSIADAQSRLSYAQVVDLWCQSGPFRAFFAQVLADSPLPAFRWETPPVTSATVGRDFEFVLLRADALERAPDPTAFARHFTDDEVVAFANLGGDALMVAPCPRAHDARYGHLAGFVRSAPESQIDQLWQTVGRAMRDRIGDRPVWLNTAGMGVAWLHVRLDSRPKYYGYAPFKRA